MKRRNNSEIFSAETKKNHSGFVSNTHMNTEQFQFMLFQASIERRRIFSFRKWSDFINSEAGFASFFHRTPAIRFPQHATHNMSRNSVYQKINSNSNLWFCHWFPKHNIINGFSIIFSLFLRRFVVPIMKIETRIFGNSWF